MGAFLAAVLLAALAVSASGGLDAELARLDKEILRQRGECAGMPEEWAKLSCYTRLDQHVRQAWMNSPTRRGADANAFNAALNERMTAVDAESREFLKRMMESKGWPRIGTDGETVAHEAWLIAQHADRDVEFQKKVLAILAELHPKGEAKPADYAYLFDRVAVNEKRPQRYGTQGGCQGASWEPAELEQPRDVDSRRAAVGLPPLAEYRRRFAGVCP